jgi:hypothetical protein
MLLLLLRIHTTIYNLLMSTDYIHFQALASDHDRIDNLHDDYTVVYARLVRLC